MQLAQRFRIPAVLCAVAVLVCELISRPYANMGVCDDWPYILMARNLVATGKFVYNGWAAPLIGWQLYLGAAFVKLFGPSMTSVRMSTLLVAMVLAFLLQRTLVRANVNERNATIATLAFVLSPLYLVLSVTFMTDIQGLFALVICLYGCLRALEAKTSNAAIGWIVFAVATNAVFGTARQIAWLGILVMVPCTVWLLRAERRVVIAGVFATALGAGFIFGCLQWLKHQPYSIPERVLPEVFHLGHTISALSLFYLEIPLLVLPLTAAFLPELRKQRLKFIAVLAVLLFCYLFLATYPSHLRGDFPLEPTSEDWLSAHGSYLFVAIHGASPIFIGRVGQILLTAVSLACALSFIGSLLRGGAGSTWKQGVARVSWKQLAILLAPFTVAYGLLLIPRAADTSGLSDRYLLGLIVVAMLCLARYYQERVEPRLPLMSAMLVGMMAVWGVIVTHNTFSFYRARAALATEVRDAGVPDTSVDYGWEYNLGVELQHASHVNFPGIVRPSDAYVPARPLPAGTCFMYLHDYTPHIVPRYGVSFDPNACYGAAPFSPVHYSRWPGGTGTLYIVRYTPGAS